MDLSIIQPIFTTFVKKANKDLTLVRIDIVYNIISHINILFYKNPHNESKKGKIYLLSIYHC